MRKSPKTIKTYRIIKKLEETNTAVIYKVQDSSSVTRSLKIARLNTKEHNDLITREFQILHKIKHPTIVSVTDLETDADGRAFFLQPFIPGKAIDVCFTGFNEDLANALLEIVNALAVLHNRGFIHGDLKPEHLLYDTSTRNTVLIDFGYARIPDDQNFRTGTIGYIAPEVIKGIGLDQRSDIYSLGVIIHKILTGRLIPAPWQDIPKIPDTINALLRRMCAVEPAVRPMLSEIYDVLAHFGTVQGVKAPYDVRIPPTTFVERARIMDTLLGARGTAYTVCGDTGTGKTRLLLELKYRFIRQGYTTFYCFAGEQVSLFGSLCTFLGIQKEDIIDGNNRHALFQNVVTSIRQNTTRSPMVFLIDEVETMKDFDRALLRYVGFGLKEMHAGVICTTIDPRIARTIGFDMLKLDPFTNEETEQMITTTLCPMEFSTSDKSHSLQHLTQWLNEQSGGNPLYLVELLTTLFKQNILTFSQHGWHIDSARLDDIQIPRHLENLILKRYEHLNKREQTVLQTLALVEIPLDPGILAALFTNECFASLELLKHEGLIKEDIITKSHAVFIPNQILRKLVRSRTRKQEQNKYRKKLLQTFEHIAPLDPRYIPLLAALYDTIGDHGKAIEYAGHAVQHAEAEYDHATAVDFYRIIMKNTPPRVKGHTTTALKIAGLLTTMGRCKEAIAIYQNLYKRAATSFHKHIITGIGRTYYHMGNYDDAIVHLRKALNMHKKTDTEPIIDLQTRLAYCLSVTGKFDEAKEFIGRSITNARATGKANLFSAALYYKAVLEHQQGELDQSIRSAEEHIRFAEETGIPHGSALSTLLLSRIYQEQNDLEKALHYVDRAIENLEKSRDIAALLNAMDCKATILFNQGKINQAYILYEQTLLKAKQVDSNPTVISCLSALNSINLMMGKFQQALANAEEGLTYAPKRNSLLSDMVDIYSVMEDINKTTIICKDIPPDFNDIYSQKIHMRIAVNQMNQDRIREYIKNIEQILTTTPNIQLQRINIYIDLMTNLYQIQEYRRCAEYAQIILHDTSCYDIFHVIAQAYIKLIAFHKSDAPLDISMEIEQLRHASVVYEMLRLQRLKIQALMTKPLAIETVWKIGKELLDCIEIARSIQAHQETARLLDLQHALFSKIVHQELMGSAPAEYLAVFSRIATLIERGLGNENFLKDLLDIVIPTTKAERGALFLNTPQGIEFIVGRDMDQTTLADAAELSRTAIREIHKNKIVITHNAQLDPDFNLKKSVVLNKIRSLLCIPLTIDDNVIGALYLDSRFQDKMFSEHDKDFLLTVARILAAVIDKSRALQKIIDDYATLRTSVITDIGQGYLISTSKAMKKVYELIDQVAATNSPVLLIGETGTGKGMLARLIHQRSARQDKNFTVINCGTIPETLLESELFGHKKGAFTGALADKPGLLEHAHGGTVFLDELTNTSPAFQAKLLEAIDDKVIRRVGETRTYTIDVRFIFATNKDLEIEVEEGRFRKDLYYRINVFKIDIPPLRERGADIILLARFFLEKCSKEIGKKVVGFTPKAMKDLRRYYWAGNVRELRHVVERAVVLAKGINIAHPELNLDARKSGEPASIQEIKKEAIIEALEAANYHTSQAARVLGVSRRTVQRYRKIFNL